MKQNLTELEACDILLEEAVEFKLKRRSLLRFIQKRRTIKIEALTLETLYRVAKEVNRLKLETKQEQGLLSIVSQNSQSLAKIVAICVLGSKIVLFRSFRESFLSHYLASRLSITELELVFEKIQYQCNLEGFINSIKLAVGLKITRPKKSLIE